MRNRYRIAGLVVFATCLRGWTVTAAVAPEWKYSQTIHVSAAGLNRAKLPLDTVSAAKPSLADLRLIDPQGREVSYIVDRPASAEAREMLLASTAMTAVKGKTVITGRVPVAMEGTDIRAIHLYSPTDDFLKPLTIAVSKDGRQWTTLLRQYPIFKQPGQDTSTAVELPAAAWTFLRIALDDSGTPPIRVQGVSLVGGARAISGLDGLTASIVDVNSDAHRTDVQIELPADHLWIDSIELRAAETTFRRPVTVLTKEFTDGEFRETLLGHGLIYRVALGGAAVEQLSVPLNRQTGRRLILRIENGDSRPLDIQNVRAEAIPQSLVFDALMPGDYALWFGDPAASAPAYDVAAMSDVLSKKSAAVPVMAPAAPNPAFRPVEPLPQVPDEGGDIDVTLWKYRKKVNLLGSGIQRLEIDLETLAHNQAHPAALRLVRDGKQIPYVVDTTGVNRSFNPALQLQPAKGHLSRWTVKMPYPATPVQQLRFTVSDPFFQRTISASEEITDDRGETVRQMLGQAAWTRLKGENKEGFIIDLNRTPVTDAIELETDDGDNAPIHLVGVQGYYQAPRLLFKASPSSKPLYLYYGQP
ncbi:MAG TPA: DUF3999 family protein, partial [Elusimicrobiota bacterium]|nr:DUF3999 family protein [Elusimicrobiota bacterium]